MYTALLATSQTLAAYLRKRLEADTNLRLFFDPALGGNMIVSLRNPEDMSENNDQGLSMWLYRIVRDDERLNAPPDLLGQTQLRRTPLPLRVHFLMTPVVNRQTVGGAELAQTVLGKVLQALYDHPEFRGADFEGDFKGTTLELRARLEPLALDEMSRIWDALGASYQLSVSYEVAVVLIDSEVVEDTSLVREVEPEYGVIVAGGG